MTRLSEIYERAEQMYPDHAGMTYGVQAVREAYVYGYLMAAETYQERIGDLTWAAFPDRQGGA